MWKQTQMILLLKETHKRTYGWDSKALATGHVQLKVPCGQPSQEKPFSVRSINAVLPRGGNLDSWGCWSDGWPHGSPVTLVVLI